MNYELFGSFLAFASALVVADLRRPRLSLALTAVFFVVILSWNPYYATFVAGVGMAQVYVLCGERLPRVRVRWVLLAAFVAFILFGFRGTLEGGKPVGFYAGLAHLPRITGLELQTLLHSLAALLIMGIVMSSPLCRTALGGRFGAWIGRMSFPIYLTHLVVICSAGSLAFVWLSARLPHGPAIGASILATVAITFAVSYPVMLFDQWWVRRVNAVAGRLRPAPAPDAASPPMRVVFPASVQIPSQSAA
jgi:peptidoglycan/LPS O-acetylase OafA/YrhL